MTNLCIDLCCGLGGFSQAFSDDPTWEVIRIDISDKLGANIVADVRHLPLIEGLRPDVLLMSPPCTHFSLARNRWPTKGIKDAMEIVGACLEAVATLKPRYWMLENPRGRLRWFIGKPYATISLGDYGSKIMKPTDLWGNVPLPIRASSGVRGIDANRKNLQRNLWPRDSSKRAELPRGLSIAIRESVEQADLQDVK